MSKKVQCHHIHGFHESHQLLVNSIPILDFPVTPLMIIFSSFLLSNIHVYFGNHLNVFPVLKNVFDSKTIVFFHQEWEVIKKARMVFSNFFPVKWALQKESNRILNELAIYSFHFIYLFASNSVH